MKPMGDITTCPACATSFRVVPDLLRISDGWVRCGKCAEVFDANAALRRADGHPLPGVQSASPEESVLSDPVHEVLREAIGDMPAPAVPDPEPVPSVGESAVQERIEPSLESEPAPPPPSFMQSDAEEPRRNRIGTAVLGLLLVLAMLGLVFQMAYQERDRIAAMLPQSRPFLAMTCAHLGCVIGPIKQIESVVIEASSFNRVRADNYRLVLSMRNAAPVEVALPALDLALTDSTDQVVFRRVFLPHEFAAGAGALAPRAEWSGQVSVQVRQTAAVEKFTGYRLYAFYP